ncbi:hypothetical protein [Nocardioides stalactiti]|uniref:hypothetical protein n=1 Tax=Nocardioides stalactiti TaxID=2755356 RepID=UPI0015FF852D|nr:hypothetical protein [Nocardioides stalactiti]
MKTFRNTHKARRGLRTTRHRACAALLVLVTTIAMTVAAVPRANAETFGRESNCGGWGRMYHTNRWDFFAGHHMDPRLGICHNGSLIFWGKNPGLTFPTRNFLTGSLEDLDVVSAPQIVKKKYCFSRVCSVKWGFSVKQRISGTPIGQTFDFTVEIFTMGSKICSVGGTCDTTKTWF